MVSNVRIWCSKLDGFQRTDQLIDALLGGNRGFEAERLDLVIADHVIALVRVFADVRVMDINTTFRFD